MKCADSIHGEYEIEQFRISIEGEPDIWIRRHPEVGYPAEVITQNARVEEALEPLAKQCPEEVEILSMLADGGFHAFIGPVITSMLFYGKREYEH